MWHDPNLRLNSHPTNMSNLRPWTKAYNQFITKTYELPPCASDKLKDFFSSPVGDGSEVQRFHKSLRRCILYFSEQTHLPRLLSFPPQEL
ncbi:hypothetical protein CEXT_793751 [Caerostris extrusa]|uniref:Uncharacterized protein n=1 Tax=Caerostris extrusa TaxID=172846 RepID=A0AAV4Y6R4_CAEEX|nr:hypothetical protein CEXT_793751 [Caerostris extrusa]